MLVLVDLMEFEVIAAPKLGAAFSHRVVGFRQVVTEITVSGFNHLRVFRFKFTGLVFVPDKAGKLGNRGLRVETVDIANLSDDTGGADLPNAMEVIDTDISRFTVLGRR